MEVSIMARMIRTYEQDNPQLKRVGESADKELLLWAHSEKYILLTMFRNIYYYTQEDYEKASMWANKVGWYDNNKQDGN